MKTIEERAKECTRRRADVLVGTTLASIFEKGYIAGATDQKIIDEGIKIKKFREVYSCYKAEGVVEYANN